MSETTQDTDIILAINSTIVVKPKKHST